MGEGGLLMEPYTDYGSGLTLFYPANGLGSINTTQYEEFKTDFLYVSWHPGPTGHRVYAEILAYHYVTTLLETFADTKDLIDDLTPAHATLQQPIEEMLEILEDPPTLRELPHDGVAKQCDPFCTNATEAVCISGYRTLGKPRYSLKRWRQKEDHSEDIGQWKYVSYMQNEQAFIYKQGGQGNNDIKENWATDSESSNELKFRFEAKQYGFVQIQSDKIEENVNTNKNVEIIINEIDMETGGVATVATGSFKSVGVPLQCVEIKDKKAQWILTENGCAIGGLQPYQKYELVINVIGKTFFNVKNIRIF